MNDLLKEMQASYNILQLEKDWDEDGALAISEIAFNNALLFLHVLFKKSGNLILAPDINPVCNGGVDIAWRNKNGFRLLLHFTPKNTVSWFGDNGRDKNVVKGNIIIHNSRAFNLALFGWIEKKFRK
jgi:hypothetical protein